MVLMRVENHKTTINSKVRTIEPISVHDLGITQSDLVLEYVVPSSKKSMRNQWT